MSRANRHFIPGQIWYITHCCHKREFLFKFARDRQRGLGWLFEARKRMGLCVLDFIATCNHVHLLVSMGIPIGRTGGQKGWPLGEMLFEQEIRDTSWVWANGRSISDASERQLHDAQLMPVQE